MNKIEQFLAGKRKGQQIQEPSINMVDIEEVPEEPAAQKQAPNVGNLSVPQGSNKIEAFLASKRASKPQQTAEPSPAPKTVLKAAQQDLSPAQQANANLGSWGAQFNKQEDTSAPLLDALPSVAQGATFGWSDEIADAASAAARKVAGDEREYQQIYEELRQVTQQEQADFANKHPKTKIALELLGGLATGGIGGAKVLGTQAVKNLPKLGQAGVISAVGAGEGALAGAGSAQDGGALEGAITGGTIGAILPQALNIAGAGGRKLLGTVGEQRVAQDMGSGENFIPYNLAANEGDRLQNIYQKWVAPSLGGKQLRAQNKRIKDANQQTLGFAEQDLADATGVNRLAAERKLRQEAIAASVPTTSTLKQIEALKQLDGQDAIRELDNQWTKGFKEVKSQTFQLSPDDISAQAISDLTGVVDDQYQSQVKRIIKKQLEKGFTPDMGPPATAYSTKGLGSVKNPDVELDTGKISGENLMQARNELRMQARELGDDGAAALEKRALNKAANSIDRTIRDGLEAVDPAMAKRFDTELEAWGNYQTQRSATEKAAATQQGLYKPSQLIQAAKEGNRRAAASGDARFQQAAQKVQLATDAAKEQAQNGLAKAKANIEALRPKMAKINPTPWESTVSTAAMSAPFLPTSMGRAFIPLGVALGAGLSTQGAQRALAGQTAPQKMLADLLRQYEGSGLQQVGQAMPFGISNTAIMNQNEGY